MEWRIGALAHPEVACSVRIETNGFALRFKCRRAFTWIRAVRLSVGLPDSRVGIRNARNRPTILNGMREILEDAAVVYRQEAEGLLIIVSPAIVLGPVLVVVAASGLRAGLAAIPAFLLLYLAAYAACVRAAGLVLSNQQPDPRLAYLSMLRQAQDVVRAAAPLGLLLAVVLASVFFLSDEGFHYLGLAVGLLGAAAAIHWSVRHAYEYQLILVHDLGAKDAREVGRHLAEGRVPLTVAFLTAIGLPLLAAALASWGLAAAVNPAFGGAVLASALALWLPFAALCLTDSCLRLVDRTAASEKLL